MKTPEQIIDQILTSNSLDETKGVIQAALNQAYLEGQLSGKQDSQMPIIGYSGQEN